MKKGGNDIFGFQTLDHFRDFGFVGGVGCPAAEKAVSGQVILTPSNTFAEANLPYLQLCFWS